MRCAEPFGRPLKTLARPTRQTIFDFSNVQEHDVLQFSFAVSPHLKIVYVRAILASLANWQIEALNNRATLSSVRQPYKLGDNPSTEFRYTFPFHSHEWSRRSELQSS